MDDLYRDYILEHYRHPHNFGVIETPDLRWEGANPLCGDRITMMLTVDDGTIADVAFTGRGCAISQASASLLTDELRGKTLDEAARFTPDDILDLLGIEISPARLKCALLSLDTLEHAIAEGGRDGATPADAGTTDGTGAADAPGAGAPGAPDAGAAGAARPGPAGDAASTTGAEGR